MESRFRWVQDVDLREWGLAFLRPRYIALAATLYLAMYVAMKFILVLFNATDPAERWPFDLTPFAALRLPDVQLAFLSAAAVVVNAYLHYSTERRHRVWGMALTGSMVLGLLLALRTAAADLDPVNVGRLAVLILLLAIVPLDNRELLRSRQEDRAERTFEEELESLRETFADAGPVSPAAVTQALQELEALVNELPEAIPDTGPASLPTTEARPAPKAHENLPSDEEYMQELMTSFLQEAEKEGVRPARPAPPAALSPPPEEPIRRRGLEEEAVAIGRRLTTAFRRSSREPTAILAEARAYLGRDQLDKALRRLDRLAEIDVAFPGLWAVAADVYEAMGEPEAAEECRRRERRSAGRTTRPQR